MNKEEFSLMRFPVFDLPLETELLGHFPELKSYKEFAEYKDKDRNLVFRYVFFCYDKNSPLIQMFSDLKKRKDQALELAGFERDTKTGKFKKDISSIINLENDNIIELVFCFVRLQKYRFWMMIVSTEQAFDEYQRLIFSPVSDTKKRGESKEEVADKDILGAATTKGKLMDECDAMNKRIDLYYKELFGDNEDLKKVAKVKFVSPQSR